MDNEVIKLYKNEEGKIAYELPLGMSGNIFRRILLKNKNIQEAKKELKESSSKSKTIKLWNL